MILLIGLFFVGVLKQPIVIEINHVIGAQGGVFSSQQNSIHNCMWFWDYGFGLRICSQRCMMHFWEIVGQYYIPCVNGMQASFLKVFWKYGVFADVDAILLLIWGRRCSSNLGSTNWKQLENNRRHWGQVGKVVSYSFYVAWIVWNLNLLDL